jgi:hypothetical protein
MVPVGAHLLEQKYKKTTLDTPLYVLPIRLRMSQALPLYCGTCFSQLKIVLHALRMPILASPLSRALQSD